MGVKRKCRELNQVKNDFLKWLKANKAEDIDVFIGEDFNNEWDYYRNISAFIGETFYIVTFTMWQDTVKIRYRVEDNIYDNMGIEEFKQLLH